MQFKWNQESMEWIRYCPSHAKFDITSIMPLQETSFTRDKEKKSPLYLNQTYIRNSILQRLDSKCLFGTQSAWVLRVSVGVSWMTCMCCPSPYIMSNKFIHRLLAFNKALSYAYNWLWMFNLLTTAYLTRSADHN